ncbi:MAG: PAS domain S-box protein, partial [Spirulinaceae cyanobacterium]
SSLQAKVSDNKQDYPSHPATSNLTKLGIFIILNKGKFLYANQQLAKIFGYSFAELVALESLFTVVATSNLEQVTQEINRSFQDRKKVIDLTFQGRCKDASLINVEIYGNRTKFYGKTAIIGALRQAV